MDRETMSRRIRTDAGILFSARGFTLVELMVTLACVAIVSTAIYSSFVSQIYVEGKEQWILNTQINSRVVLDRLTWLFRHAGYGCRDSFRDGRTMTGIDPGNRATITVSAVLSITDNASAGTNLNPDEVLVVTGFTKIAEVNGDHDKATTGNNLLLKNVDTPSLDPGPVFKRYITFAPYPDNVFFTVTSTGNPYTLDRSVWQVGDNSEVYMVTPIRVQVQPNNLLWLQNFAYQSIAVERELSWEVAEGIEDLQFQYTADGGATWSGNPANPSAVQAVRIFLLARSSTTDMKHTDTKTYDLAGQIVGPFNDHFHRLLSQTTVWLRN
jgi:type IV pilus assembly protein PilW